VTRTASPQFAHAQQFDARMPVATTVIAHIGGIPVEEWAPFLVPVLALYFWGRRANRRHRADVERLPDVAAGLDRATTDLVLAQWSQARHDDLSAEFVPLIYPPGPEGQTAGEIAQRIHADRATVEDRLEQLQNLGYVELRLGEDSEDRRAWLTIKGFDLLDRTETALIASSSR
jgi:hypothetical protein